MVIAVSRDRKCRMNKDECLSTFMSMSVQPILALYNQSIKDSTVLGAT